MVDFIFHYCRLVVKVDGGQQAVQTEYDQQREIRLRERGYQVLRFWDPAVTQQLDGVLERIRLAACSPSPPTPLPLAGEGSFEPL